MLSQAQNKPLFNQTFGFWSWFVGFVFFESGWKKKTLMILSVVDWMAEKEAQHQQSVENVTESYTVGAFHHALSLESVDFIL